jgi:hypothetical protein
VTLRGLAWAAGGAAVAALAVWGWMAQQASAERARGAAIFRGEAPLAGRLTGHDVAFPALATRCSNCHGTEPATPTGASIPYATALTGTELTTPRVRRGGPRSSFDSSRLCTLLRDGTDPSHVVISTTMPRYDATDAQCDDLWAYLKTR